MVHLHLMKKGALLLNYTQEKVPSLTSSLAFESMT